MKVSPISPHARCGAAQRLGKLRRRERSAKNSVDRQFSDHQIARYAGQMEHQRLDVEVATLGARDLVLHDIDIAIVDIDSAVVNTHPRPAVEHSTSPRTEIEYLTLPAEIVQVLGIEVTAIVDRSVPIATRAMSFLST